MKTSMAETMTVDHADVIADEAAVLSRLMGDGDAQHRARKRNSAVPVSRPISHRLHVTTTAGSVWVDVTKRTEDGRLLYTVHAGDTIDYDFGGDLTTLSAAVERGVSMIR